MVQEYFVDDNRIIEAQNCIPQTHQSQMFDAQEVVDEYVLLWVRNHELKKHMGNYTRRNQQHRKDAWHRPFQ